MAGLDRTGGCDDRAQFVLTPCLESGGYSKSNVAPEVSLYNLGYCWVLRVEAPHTVVIMGRSETAGIWGLLSVLFIGCLIVLPTSVASERGGGRLDGRAKGPPWAGPVAR